jgi:voltage-gated potassium channel
MRQKLRAISGPSVIVAALGTIPVVILEEQGSASAWLLLADWAIWIVFAAALGVDLSCAADRPSHLRRHPIDVAVVVLSFPMLPHLLALTRLIRIFRVLRVMAIAARSIPALKATIGRSEMLYVGSICVILVISAAVTLQVLEPDTVGGSFANALWWSAVTVTTVGYGDITPVSVPGRIAAGVIMLAGLGLISTLSASIAAYFVDQGKQSGLAQIEDRLERIERILNQGAAEQKEPARK